VIVRASVRTASNTFEIVEIELSTEGGYLSLIEEPRHQDRLKLGRVSDGERSTMRLPTEDVIHAELLYFMEKSLKLERELSSDLALMVVVERFSFLDGAWFVDGLLASVDIVMVNVDSLLAFRSETWRTTELLRFGTFIVDKLVLSL